MKWTTEAPTVPGWYWFRYSQFGPASICRVNEGDTPAAGCQWYGPLTPPTGSITKEVGKMEGLRNPRERYFNDPQFHALVDLMVSHLLRCDYTPAEMREAAMVASMKYYELRPQGLTVKADELHKLMRMLEED